MPESRIKIEGAERLINHLENYPNISIPFINTAIQHSIIEVQSEALWLVPRDTSNLANSLRRGISFSNLRGRLWTDVNYAVYVHEGTRPHWIGSPVNLGHGIGWRYIGMHPGFGGVPFLRAGIESSMSKITNYFEYAVEQIINAIK